MIDGLPGSLGVRGIPEHAEDYSLACRPPTIAKKIRAKRRVDPGEVIAGTFEAVAEIQREEFCDSGILLGRRSVKRL